MNQLNLTLERTYYPTGTNGKLSIGNNEFCNTIELPWKENKTGISCIPEGRYRLSKRYSQHHGNHLILNKVQCRDLILIHKANDALKELRGCIAPVKTITGAGQGSYSGIPFHELIEIVYKAIDSGSEVWLTIGKK